MFSKDGAIKVVLHGDLLWTPFRFTDIPPGSHYIKFQNYLVEEIHKMKIPVYVISTPGKAVFYVPSWGYRILRLIFPLLLDEAFRVSLQPPRRLKQPDQFNQTLSKILAKQPELRNLAVSWKEN